MAFQNGEARRDGNLDRASNSSRGSNVFEDTALPSALQAERLVLRLGISAAVAALVVELAGLGPREARR